MEKKQQHATHKKISPTAKERSPQKENSQNLERSECKQTEGKGPQKHNQIFRKDCERERERGNPTFDFLHLKKGNLHQKLITCQQVSAIHSFSVIIKSEHVNAMTLPCTIFGSGFRPSLSSLSLPFCVSVHVHDCSGTFYAEDMKIMRV